MNENSSATKRDESGPVVAFFDVDGTLVARPPDAPGAEPTKRVASTVREFARAGGIPIISTGRALVGVTRLLELIPFCGCVTMDGAYVELGGRVVVDRSFPQPLLEQSVLEMQRLGMSAFLEGTEQCVEFSPSGSSLFGEVPLVTRLEDLRAIKPDLRFGKIDFYGKDYGLYRKSDFLVRELQYYDVGYGSHELVMPGVDKGTGARQLLAALANGGCVPKRVYAFGDSENDIPLFKVADVAVAMGQAAQPVRDAADIVAEACERDGVAMALERLGLLG